MSFPDDLLEQAYDLASKEPVNPKQASLRRALSTAYYALFHLLIDEAVSKWTVERQRSILARTFEHKKMRSVCDDIVRTVKSGGNVSSELHTVALSFIRLQHYRYTADYNNAVLWSRTELDEILPLAKLALEFCTFLAFSGQRRRLLNPGQRGTSGLFGSVLS